MDAPVKTRGVPPARVISSSMNAIINDLPKTIPNSYVISSAGCTALLDRLHFDPAGLREFGKRYGEKMLSLLGHQIVAPK